MLSNVQEIEKKLLKVSKILSQKRKFMASFMKNYMFKQIDVSSNKLLEENNFKRVIDFCLNTRQRMNENEYSQAKVYFKKHYKNFVKGLREARIDNLKKPCLWCTGSWAKDRQLNFGSFYSLWRTLLYKGEGFICSN